MRFRSRPPHLVPKHTVRRWLEALEDRTVPTTISIGNASATEGGATYRFTDDFVSAGSGGVQSPRYIAFGPDGNLYVASKDSNEVLRYDGATGAFLGAAIPSSAGLVGPFGETFGPDGNLYVTGFGSNDVFRYNLSTGTAAEFVSAGSGGLMFPKALTFGPDGNLYVASADDGPTSPAPDEVIRYNGTGAFMGVFVANGSGGLDNPAGLAFGPDGNLYVSNTRGDSINRYNGATGAFVNTFVASGSGGLDAPVETIFRDGKLFVAGQFTNALLEYDATTGAYFGSISGGSLNEPDGFDFDATGNIYVGSTQSNQVLRYGPASEAAFTISLDAASSSPVSVNFATIDGTATAGSDYVPTSGTVTFAPGETTRTILVPTIDDTIPEPTESFTVNLSNPVGATITTAQGAGTIFDNDPVQVAKVAINGGSAQRSEVRSIAVTFTGQVTLPANPANAFQLQNVTDGNNVASAASVATDGLGRTIVTLTFSGPETDPVSAENSGVPSLADGRYSLTIAAASVIGSDGLALDGAGTGTAGSNYVSPTDTRGGGPGQLGLYRLFGDTNGDGIVDQLDLGQFRSANNSSAGNPSYLADLDADNSGSIDQFDLAQFRQRNNSSVFPMTPGGTPMPVPAPIPSPNFFPGPIVAAPPVAASPGESIAADGIEADSVVRRGLLTITGVSSIDWLTASAALKHKSSLYADWLASANQS